MEPRWPGWLACAAALLLGLCLWPFAHEVGLWVRAWGAEPSEEYFETYLDSDPGSIGRTILINEQTMTIVGVLPRGFPLQLPSPQWPGEILYWQAFSWLSPQSSRSS